MNLLEETIKVLKENNIKQQEVLWVGAHSAYMSWNKFKAKANIEYNASYGREEINVDLLVVGADWWLERHEHDGSEWWEFKTLPKLPKKREDIDIWQSKFYN